MGKPPVSAASYGHVEVANETLMMDHIADSAKCCNRGEDAHRGNTHCPECNMIGTDGT